MSMQLTVFEHSKTEKRCCRCKEIKPLSNFCKCKRAKDGFQHCCRQCQTLYYQNNKEVILHLQKVYYQNNKEAHSKHMKLYYEKNKEAYAIRSRAYEKKRLKSDPLFRVIINLRTRVRNYCRSIKFQKSWSTSKAMGCTREEFIAYFESKFTERMTWENYGTWHVDHIKPISLATTEQEAIELSHYTNLQPLWAEDNLRKSNKYD